MWITLSMTLTFERRKEGRKPLQLIMKRDFTKYDLLQQVIIRKCIKFRHEMGYTQAQVASELGYSQTNISEFESGRSSSFRVLLWYLGKGLKL